MSIMEITILFPLLNYEQIKRGVPPSKKRQTLLQHGYSHTLETCHIESRECALAFQEKRLMETTLKPFLKTQVLLCPNMSAVLMLIIFSSTPLSCRHLFLFVCFLLPKFPCTGCCMY